METRIVTEAKTYLLVLNPMTGRMEGRRLVAASYSREKLIAWYNDQFASEPWKDDNWSKTFKQGSPIEWCNPAAIREGYDEWGHGIDFQWVDITSERPSDIVWIEE